MYGQLGTRKLTWQDAEALLIALDLAAKSGEFSRDDELRLRAMRAELVEADRRDAELSDAIERSYDRG